METLFKLCFEMVGGLLDFLLLGQFNYITAKRKLKHLQEIGIIAPQKPFDRNTIRHILKDHRIATCLFQEQITKNLSMTKMCKNNSMKRSANMYKSPTTKVGDFYSSRQISFSVHISTECTVKSPPSANNSIP